MRSRTVSYAASDEELFREQMRSSAQGDGAHPKTFAYLLVKATTDRVWERLTNAEGEPFVSFKEFLEAEDPHGLGMSVSELLHAVALGGPEAEGAVKTLLRDEIEPAARMGRPQKGNVRTTNINRSETADYLTARLKRDDPALAEKVVSGELSAYAAARSKGWKPPRIQVTTPERTAAHLRRYMSTEDLALLAKLITED